MNFTNKIINCEVYDDYDIYPCDQNSLPIELNIGDVIKLTNSECLVTDISMVSDYGDSAGYKSTMSVDVIPFWTVRLKLRPYNKVEPKQEPVDPIWLKRKINSICECIEIT